MTNNSLGHVYNDGEVILKQGSVGDCFYVIQKGMVEIVDETGDKETVVAKLGETDFFGEMGIFEKDVRSCTVRAKGEATILTMDKRSLYKSIQKDPSLAFRLLEKMSNRLRETTKQMGAK
ncbi:cyclic nucleotide-binding domain-containing protein [Prolixibacteraceae bacterium Z1-6]|uniref:Cyclic nucleotide-binding domain-containing protein n=1 Tax=Draconibacterium aestuarii TaxID=2998507 RepID=A0A9X3FFP8_9BACT|nr:cyclic nucleotide-binding domain-containing protein [Prolixibacteraceae bacterium Z1-6]